MHAFWMALSAFILALFSGYGSLIFFLLFYCLTLSPFCTFSFWPFSPPAFCLADNPLHFLFCLHKCLDIHLFLSYCLYFTLLHTYTHTHTFRVPHLLPSFPFSVLSPFLHSSLLPKDKRSGVSMSGGACGGERSTPVEHRLLKICRHEFSSISILALQLNEQ